MEYIEIDSAQTIIAALLARDVALVIKEVLGVRYVATLSSG